MSIARRAFVVATAIVCASLASGCSDGNPRAPFAPTSPQTPSAPPSPPPATLYALSGEVFEMTAAGRSPVAGVEVYCEPCGPPDGHSARFTDALGVYSFDGVGGVAAGAISVLLAKQGYVLLNHPDESGASGLGWMGATRVQVIGDTRHDIEIKRK